MVTKRKVDYNINVQTKNAAAIKALSRDLTRFNKNVRSTARSAKRASRDLGSLRRGFQGFIGVLGIREITRASDRIQLLRDRVRILSESNEEAQDTFRGIVEIAKRTKTSVDGIGISYNRLSLATKELGLSNEQILNTTEALQNTFRLSGSTIAEATSSTIQLSQGLSAGALRGQELRSVLEANAVLAGLLAKEFGVARGQLIKLAETGAITSDRVFKILLGDFEDLSKQAGRLKTTFGQSFTLIFDRISIKLDEMNEKFSISQNFEKFANFFIDNIDSIAIAVGALAAGRSIVVLTEQINLLALGLRGLVSTEIVAGLTTLFGSAGLLVGVGGILASLAPSTADAVDSFEDARKEIKRIEDRVKDLRLENAKLNDSFRSGNLDRKVFEKEIQRNVKTIRSLKDEIRGLAKFSRGLGRETRRNSKVKYVADEQLLSVKELNKLFKDSDITLREYRRGVAELELKKLNEDFDTGKIKVDKYNESLRSLNSTLRATGEITQGVQDGISGYIKSAGTLAENIASATSKVFKGLEDQLFDFVKNGKLEFRDLTQSILDDLLRIALRQAIVLPFANAALGAFGGTTTAPTGIGTAGTGSTSGQSISGAFAKGGAFNNGSVVPFAAGGVTSSPTFFPMSGGRTGLMGEDGPEGILPLSKVNGKLGVNAEGLGSNVNVNVINNSGAEVQTEESEGPNGDKQIDIIIGNKVNGLIAKGSFDRTFNQSFGIRRKGK